MRTVNLYSSHIIQKSYNNAIAENPYSNNQILFAYSSFIILQKLKNIQRKMRCLSNIVFSIAHNVFIFMFGTSLNMQYIFNLLTIPGGISSREHKQPPFIFLMSIRGAAGI